MKLPALAQLQAMPTMELAAWLLAIKAVLDDRAAALERDATEAAKAKCAVAE